MRTHVFTLAQAFTREGEFLKPRTDRPLQQTVYEKTLSRWWTKVQSPVFVDYPK